MDYFTSDTHFNHANIIKYCNRPFSSVDEMNMALVGRWNEVVKPTDRVFHLGDFAMGKHADAVIWFASLNGEKHLISGNHDSKTVRTMGWHTTNDCAPYELDDDRTIFLIHNPGLVKKRPSSGLVLHGHLHGMSDLHPFTKLPHTTYVDVGVDCWDYRPSNLQDIMERAK